MHQTADNGNWGRQRWGKTIRDNEGTHRDRDTPDRDKQVHTIIRIDRPGQTETDRNRENDRRTERHTYTDM